MQGALVGLALFHLVLHAADSSEALQAACRNGDGASCVRLGDRFERGVERGVKDACRARIWYQLACELRHPAGCSRLGRLYRYGMCVSLDEDLAATYFDLACNRWYPAGWDPVACVDLGVLYEDGTGPPQDISRAEALYEKGCSGDAARGCANLGCRLLARNPERARELLRKAEAGGVRPGCVPVEPPKVRVGLRAELDPSDLTGGSFLRAPVLELSLWFKELAGVMTIVVQPGLDLRMLDLRLEARYVLARWGPISPYGGAGGVLLFRGPSAGTRLGAGLSAQLGPLSAFTDLTWEHRFRRLSADSLMFALGAGWTF